MGVLPAFLADARRVCLVHAHPDDETFVAGALTCELVAAGVEVDVVTCTDGARGEVRPGVLDHEPTPADVVALREEELSRALDVLGVRASCRLGQTDSGMAWDGDVAVADPATGDDAFSRVPLAGPVGDLVGWIRATSPDVVVSYDALGTYGHPDHVRAHAVAQAAAVEAGLPFVEIVSGEPDEADVAWVEIDPTRMDVLRAAADCYPSQALREGDEMIHVGGQRTPLWTRNGVRPPVLPA